MEVATNVFLKEGDTVTILDRDPGGEWGVSVTFQTRKFTPMVSVFLSEEQARDLARDLAAHLDGLDHDREAAGQ